MGWRKIPILLASVLLVGCGAGGNVDTDAVQKQADKEKAINKKAEQNLPPGEGPSG